VSVRRTHAGEGRRTGEGELKKAAGLEKARGGWGQLEKASVVVDAPVRHRAAARRVPPGRLGLDAWGGSSRG
jgi:hypothetical protein